MSKPKEEIKKEIERPDFMESPPKKLTFKIDLEKIKEEHQMEAKETPHPNKRLLFVPKKAIEAQAKEMRRPR